MKNLGWLTVMFGGGALLTGAIGLPFAVIGTLSCMALISLIFLVCAAADLPM